jgi:hypothetical protein
MMADINYFLASGEIILKKQDYVLDQGMGNQSDGTLYLTNQQLIFNIKQGGLASGLDLKIKGQKDAKVEFLYMPLELIRGVDKKGLGIKVQTEGSLFQEVVGKKGLFGPKGEGRVFENGPEVYTFSTNIFVNRDELVKEILAQRDVVLRKQDAVQGSDVRLQVPQDNVPHQTIKEKIVVREIVKIKCRYCGNLYDHTSNRCPHCGGIQ